MVLDNRQHRAELARSVTEFFDVEGVFHEEVFAEMVRSMIHELESGKKKQ